MKELETLLRRLLDAATYEDSKDLDTILASQDFEDKNGFFLSVGVEGVVHAITYKGTEINRVFPAGNHPLKLKKIFQAQTTATGLGANYN